MQNLRQFWRKNSQCNFTTPQCEILGDLMAILSGGESRVTCGASIKHV